MGSLDVLRTADLVGGFPCFPLKHGSLKVVSAFGGVDKFTPGGFHSSTTQRAMFENVQMSGNPQEGSWTTYLLGGRFSGQQALWTFVLANPLGSAMKIASSQGLPRQRLLPSGLLNQLLWNLAGDCSQPCGKLPALSSVEWNSRKVVDA